MAFNSRSVILLALCCLFSSAKATVFDVTKYGAKADSKTDMSKAMEAAWKLACAATSPSQVLVPGGTYLMGVLNLAGPCKAPIDVHVQGNVLAPISIKGDSWVSFAYVDQFTLSGNGAFNGQGHQAWASNDCGTNSKCSALAVNLRFNFITNGLVRDISSVDSKNFHVNVLGCKNLTFQKFTVKAPKNSVNTDGIHIGKSSSINITNTNIGTGDDCISIGDGSEQITVTGVTCGPGHGISIGSLGRYAGEKPVKGIFVRNCTIVDAENGLRIKSWPALENGLATDMHFEDIVMKDVSNPIIIDQVYCPWNQCNPKLPSKVSISNVSFKKIRGTSKTPIPVQLICSSGVPCKDVVLSDINLLYSGSEGPATSKCVNVKPNIIGPMTPGGC